jgi:hypothetical protein
MKKIIFSLLAFLYATASIAKSPVPIAVQDAFINKFPHASHIIWKTEENGFYEIDFTMKDHHYIVTMDKIGKVVNTGEVISWLELPTQARHLLANEFQGFYMESLLQENKYAAVHYIAKFTHNNYHYVAVFEANGQTVLLHREQKMN